MKMYSLLAALLLFNAISLVPSPAAESWQTDYNAALAQAGKERKLVLLDFTGSDWCYPCIKLSKDIFSQADFKEFAAKNLVLVEVDFPARKALPDALKAQNDGLATKFGVDGFPTLVLIDAAGKEVARHVGYLPGGPDALITWVERAQQQ
jgi:thioredoxin-related protein